MEKKYQEMKELHEQWLFYTFLYPILIDAFNNMRTLEDLGNYLKKVQALGNFKILPLESKNLEEEFVKKLKFVIELLKEVEEVIIKHEEQINNREYQVFNFYVDKIRQHAANFPNPQSKIAYYAYILKEYPDHIKRRYNAMSEKNNELMIQQNDAMNELMSLYQQIINKNEKLNKILELPLPPRKLNEILFDEIKYNYQLLDLNLTYQNTATTLKWNANDTDLLELTYALFHSHSISVPSNQIRDTIIEFEKIFNITIKDKGSKISKATIRIKPTKFLSKLQKAFISYADDNLDNEL